jgi:glycosyltransferase involved in cell wall biosynthesis
VPEVILHFAQDGDTSGYFPQLAKWHDGRRYRMIFATLKPMAPWLEDVMHAHGVETLSLGCRSRASYATGAVRLARFLGWRGVSVLHTHLFEPSVVGMMAGALARTPRRLITRHYSDYHTRINKRGHVLVDRLCTRLAHAVIAVSDHTAKHLIAVEKAPRHKVEVIVNGIDFDRVRASGPDARARIRSEFAGDGAYLLLIAARLHPEKGYEYLFGALPRINKGVGKPVRLLVAGAGPFEAEYRRQVASLGCGEMVRFLGFRDDVADLMTAADLVLLPSMAEAFGLAAAEALYLGVPVVGTQVGGIPEIVSDSVDGILVPPGDSGALADAIVGLLSDEPRRLKLAGAGRAKVVGRFGFEDMVRRYERLYDRLAGAVPVPA